MSGSWISMHSFERVSARSSTRMRRLVFAVILVTAAHAAAAQTERAGSSANAQLMQQMQQLASERTQLQAENARLKKELDELKKQGKKLGEEKEAVARRA